MNDFEKLLTGLTPIPAKVAAYSGDTYFQESVAQLGESDTDVATFARDHTLLLIKPDGVIARALEPTLQWLRDNGFRVAAARRVSVSRHQMRALWYYQWNIASPERRRLADLMVTLSDSVLLVLHSDRGDLPASVTFGELKGPTNPKEREPGQLRHLLGRYTYLLNLVHSPDDPADVLRELAIYLDEDERLQLFTELRSTDDRTADAESVGRSLDAAVPKRSFDRAEALATLVGEVERIPGGAEVAAGAAAGTDAACADLIDTAWANGWKLDPWSVVVLGSHVLPMRTGSQSQTLATVSAEDWRQTMTEVHHER